MILDAVGGQYQPEYLYTGAQAWSWSGVSVATVGPPTAPGIEYSMPGHRVHLSMPGHRVHLSMPSHRIHYTTRET